MAKFKADYYYKNIYDINYSKLKKSGIKYLVYDLDNTLGLITEKNCPKESVELIKKLKKDFKVYIISNNTKKRLTPYLNELGIEGVWWSMKPFTRGLRKLLKNNNLKKSEMVIIGDQLVTDILAGNRFGIRTVLVDPLGIKDLKITSLNRLIEKEIIKYYRKRGIFERGKYYE